MKRISGMSSPLISFTAIHAIAFGVYGNTMKLFDDYNHLVASFLAGNMAGIAQCTVCIPSELLKIKLQLQVWVIWNVKLKILKMKLIGKNQK